jgi:ribosomal-protein-alanine N-acetyltransferase
MERIIFLEGPKIYLRHLQQEDLTNEYVQWLNDEEVCKGNSHAIFPNTHEKMVAYYASLQGSVAQVVLAIINKENDKHVGNVSLQSINWVSKNAEFAILLGDKNIWGKGYGEEAAKLIVEYGFSRLNLHRIYCGTMADNTSMIKLAEKLKMKQEGVRREAIFKTGTYKDVIEFGVLKNEYAN